MNIKHKRTLEATFRNPVQSGVPWKDIESLLKSLGARFQKALDLELGLL